jgi:hypothetical protein
VPELPKSIQELLEQLGFSQESVQRFRFGGIVGKVALVALGGFAGAVGVAKYTAGLGLIQIICVAGVLLTTYLIIRGILSYGEKHPSSATLEGAEIILWQQQQIMLAAKNVPSPTELQIIPNPGGAPPQLNPPQGVDE